MRCYECGQAIRMWGPCKLDGKTYCISCAKSMPEFYSDDDSIRGEHSSKFINVAGVTFDGRDVLIQNLIRTNGNPLQALLEFEHDNKFDSTAIKVFVNNNHIGYIGKNDKTRVVIGHKYAIELGFFNKKPFAKITL